MKSACLPASHRGLLRPSSSRANLSWWRHMPPKPKYLLSGPLKKRFADSRSKWPNVLWKFVILTQHLSMTVNFFSMKAAQCTRGPDRPTHALQRPARLWLGSPSWPWSSAGQLGTSKVTFYFFYKILTVPASLPVFHLSQHPGLFQWVISSHQVAKVSEFQLEHQSFQWIFRTDFL